MKHKGKAKSTESTHAEAFRDVLVYRNTIDVELQTEKMQSMTSSHATIAINDFGLKVIPIQIHWHNGIICDFGNVHTGH